MTKDGVIRRLKRSRRKIAATIAFLAALATLHQYAVWFGGRDVVESSPVRSKDDRPSSVRLYVRSKTLPVDVYLDGKFRTTLHDDRSATTIETVTGDHVVVARWVGFRYETRVSVGETDSFVVSIPAR
jgi:hypothetical protein